MATITLENTREHDITISAVGEQGVASITVPGARQNPNDKNELINGTAQADDAVVTAAKKNPVVAHYFEEGWLRVAKPEAAKKPKQE